MICCCRVFEKYEEAFIENMPLESVKELPKTYMYAQLQ